MAKVRLRKWHLVSSFHENLVKTFVLVIARMTRILIRCVENIAARGHGNIIHMTKVKPFSHIRIHMFSPNLIIRQNIRSYDILSAFKE